LRELSVIDDKGKGTALFALVGIELDSAEGNSQLVSDPMPCLDVDLYSRKEAMLYTHPSTCPPTVFRKNICSGWEHSNWVLQRAKEIHHVLGISCEGYEEQFMAILTAIEASRSQKGSTSNSKLLDRGTRELKRLACSINYDSKGGSSGCGRVKGRGFSVLNEA